MIDYASICAVGEKERNEDSIRVYVNTLLRGYGFVLADGLGGHGNGDVASNFVCDCVGAAIENTDTFDGSFIDQCFDTCQNLLMDEKNRRGLNSIKTTMVMLLITDDKATWGHIGDSRLYHFRDGKMLSRTIDHSIPQMLCISGKIKEKDIRHHPDRSSLLRAMGAEWEMPEYEIDKRDRSIRKGDSFLLCSDGFWEWIEEKPMQKYLKKGISAQDSLKMMESEVLKNGTGKGMDNYSAILINIK